MATYKEIKGVTVQALDADTNGCRSIAIGASALGLQN